MGFFKDTFFGGAEKRAAKRQKEAAIASGKVRSAAFTEAGDVLATGAEEVGGILAPAALAASEFRVGGLETGRETFRGTLERGREEVESRFPGRTFDGEFDFDREVTDPSALDDLEPFIEGGQLSFQQQLAQSGALGSSAQAKFFSDFNVSPSTKFQLEQARRFVTSGSSVEGLGGGGGNRLRRLQEVGLGLIQQGLTERFNQLGTLTGRGLTAAGEKLTGQTNIEQLRNQLAIAEGDIQTERLGIESRADTARTSTLAPLISRSFEQEAGGLGDIEVAIGEALAQGKTEEAKALALAAAGGSEAKAQAILGAAGATATALQEKGAAQASGLLGAAGAVRGTVSDIAQAAGFVGGGGLTGFFQPESELKSTEELAELPIFGGT